MAIQVNTNEQLIANRTRLGRYATIGGLAVIFAGLVASFYNNLVLAYTALILGFILSNIGAYFLNRWGLGAYKKLEDTLKGFDKRYRLYNYLLPVPHVLMTPYGITVFLLKNQDGQISGTAERWRQNSGFLGFFRSFSAEPIGDPPKELNAQKEKMQAFLTEHLGDNVQAPIEGYIVLTNPQAQVALSDVKAPVIILNKNPDGLKNALRRDKRTPTLPTPVYDQLVSLLDDTAEEQVRTTPSGWRFWQR